MGHGSATAHGAAEIELESAGVRLAALSKYRGEAYLEPFGRALKEVAEFLDSAV